MQKKLKYGLIALAIIAALILILFIVLETAVVCDPVHQPPGVCDPVHTPP
jgi:hypothetical protein